ncbi:MAG: cytochrome c biogenesis protein CcdA [Aeromicrobium sp.]
MITGVAATAASGSLLLAAPIAVLAGLVSFFSPCMMPLLPGYVSYVSGLSAADLADAKRGRMLIGTTLFVLGFSAVFISYGTLFGAIGFQLLAYQRTVNIVLGIITIAVGLVFLGFIPFAQRDFRIHAVPKVGIGAAPVLGVLFGVGWTPCLGPTLAVVLSMSMSEANAGRGSLLTLFYCIGLGLPFIGAALAYRRMIGTTRWMRIHHLAISRIGGGLMIIVGILLLSGIWQLLITQLQQWTAGYTIAI